MVQGMSSFVSMLSEFQWLQILLLLLDLSHHEMTTACCSNDCQCLIFLVIIAEVSLSIDGLGNEMRKFINLRKIFKFLKIMHFRV
jgi:hypothetical protein